VEFLIPLACGFGVAAGSAGLLIGLRGSPPPVQPRSSWRSWPARSDVTLEGRSLVVLRRAW